MTRTLLVLGITLAAALPAQADLRHVMTQSAQISVDQAYSSATRGGTTYSSQGTNVTPSVTDGGVTTNNRIGGLDMSTITSGVPDIVDTNYDVTTAGSAYSMTESLTVGDSIPTSGTTVTNGVVPTLPVMATTITGAGGRGRVAKRLSDIKRSSHRDGWRRWHLGHPVHQDRVRN